MTNFFTVASIVLLIVSVFTIVNMVGDEISSNSNLDSKSSQIITNINYELNTNFNEEDFSETSSLNGSFEGQDAFTREFLETKRS
jgi:hypothetical protein